MTTRRNGHEIPAYAGMTTMGVGSRLRGQGAAHGSSGDGARRAPPAAPCGADWIPAYAGMTEQRAQA